MTLNRNELFHILVNKENNSADMNTVLDFLPIKYRFISIIKGCTIKT